MLRKIAGLAMASLTAFGTVPPMAMAHEFMGGSAPETNVSPLDLGFTCFNRFLAVLPTRPVFSVGRILDQTGKFSNEASAGGFAVTQGLTNEIYSAYGKFLPDFNVVERTDTEIPNFDIGVWKQQLLGDPNEPGERDPKTGQIVGKGLRQYRGGQILADDYYITGAITEVNYDIGSGGAQVGVQNIGIGGRVYSMSVAMDLRIVDARTLRVVKAVSERKIYRGYETTAGVFNFLGAYLININAGTKAQEPLELGVRATAEDAVLKLVGAVLRGSDGSNYGETCADYADRTYGDGSPPSAPRPTRRADAAPPALPSGAPQPTPEAAQ
ncbi:MAG TPA: CsgG/HfaB family protein [Caulobacteraceae bacterium]|jgi:curli production assembly/transport component CsgG/holdfast attachment protein HfaB